MTAPATGEVILFPAWLIVLHTLLITLPLWWLLEQFRRQRRRAVRRLPGPRLPDL